VKAIAVEKAGQVRIVEFPIPQIKPYECLVKFLACGFCNSTDLKTIDDHLDQPAPFPLILGHEGVGEVVRVGDKVRNWKLGDRMTNPLGQPPEGSGYHRFWGNMMEYGIVQDFKVMDEMGLDKSLYLKCPPILPPQIDPIDGAVVLTLTEAYSALGNFGFRPDMDVLIYGDGPVGLALCTFLRIRGAGWIGCIGHHEDRLARIRKAGADQVATSSGEVACAGGETRKFDLVIDAVGSTKIVQEGARRLKGGGKVGIYGVIQAADARLSLADLPNNVSIHKLSFPAVRGDPMGKVVELALNGQIKLRDFYSHIIPLTEIDEGIELIRSRKAFKVILSI
jgi:L-iditol 2-dehydrogenase